MNKNKIDIVIREIKADLKEINNIISEIMIKQNKEETSRGICKV